jgi:hypothetical protein
MRRELQVLLFPSVREPVEFLFISSGSSQNIRQRGAETIAARSGYQKLACLRMDNSRNNGEVLVGFAVGLS